MEKRSGSCLCGGVRYEVQGRLRGVIACHCTTCRKHSGHFVAATATHSDNLKLLSNNSLKWYRSSDFAQRGFCQECGSPLFFKPDSGTHIAIFAGSINGATHLNLTAHIYVRNKGDYYAIDDPIDDQSVCLYEATGANLTSW